MRAGADTKERVPGLVMARWCWAGKDRWGWHGEGTLVKGVGAADLARLEFTGRGCPAAQQSLCSGQGVVAIIGEAKDMLGFGFYCIGCEEPVIRGTEQRADVVNVCDRETLGEKLAHSQSIMGVLR